MIAAYVLIIGTASNVYGATIKIEHTPTNNKNLITNEFGKIILEPNEVSRYTGESDLLISEHRHNLIHLAGLKGSFGEITLGEKAQPGGKEGSATKKKPQPSKESQEKPPNQSSSSSMPRAKIKKRRFVWGH